MKYVGSKRLIGNEIYSIMKPFIDKSEYYVEPFCGGLNMLKIVKHKNKIANDIHFELIEFYKALQNGWIPPQFISEEEYKQIRESDDAKLKGYVGFLCSFGSKYFGGYARAIKGITNEKETSRIAFNNAMSLIPYLYNTEFHNVNYYELEIPNNSFIYCDPPYQNTTEYKGADKFNSDNFWDWVRTRKQFVFVSEYNAPNDFKCIWEGDSCVRIDATNVKQKIEKLFVHNKYAHLFESYELF